MSDLQYLDKRDDRGVILRYSAHELAYDISTKALEIINVSEIYSILISKIPQKYVDLYYHKMIYETFLPIAHQLVIYRHDKQNDGHASEININANGFPCEALLWKIWPEKRVDFSFSLSNQLKISVKKTVKRLLKGQNSLKTLFHLSQHRIDYMGLRNSNIAFNYAEGFDISKRSDLFWLDGSGIDSESVIVYYENPSVMTRLDGTEKAVDVFNRHGIRQVRLWEWNVSNMKNPYDLVINKIKLLKCSNEIDKWIKNTANHLCDMSSYWSCFFEDHGIKIHLDATESGLETIVKQIALHHLNGLSVGKVRSYPPNLDGALHGYYPNNIFFTWGNDSTNRINKSNKNIENILVSGFPYQSISHVEEKKPAFMVTRHDDVKTKFNILLIDSNHDSNEGLMQFVQTTEMVAFYKAILDWNSKDEDIGLIIKPKKSHFIDGLPGIIDQINELENKTGRCALIKNTWPGKIPSAYSNGIDIVIGISTFFPSAIIECVVAGTRAIFYDFPNLQHHEKELYKWGENKVVFRDLDKMITTLKSYKNNSLSQPELGDWTSVIHDLDPFLDNMGGRRIGTYISWIQEGYRAGLKSDDVIDRANRKYVESYGIDKIFKENNNKMIEKYG